MQRTFFRSDVALGDEEEWMGNVVRRIYEERVDQTWIDGQIAEEHAEIVKTGKNALVVPRGGFR